jgi:hypothetical protein
MNHNYFDQVQKKSNTIGRAYEGTTRDDTFRFDLFVSILPTKCDIQWLYHCNTFLPDHL